MIKIIMVKSSIFMIITVIIVIFYAIYIYIFWYIEL